MPATFAKRFLASHDEALEAEGGTILYRGTDLATGRQVAIRALCIDAASDQACVDRFRRMAARTGRRCLPVIHGHYELGDCFVVTPWPDGVAPKDALRGRDGRRGRWLAPTLGATGVLAVALGVLADVTELAGAPAGAVATFLAGLSETLGASAAAPSPAAGMGLGLVLALAAVAVAAFALRRRGAASWLMATAAALTAVLASAGAAILARAVPRLEVDALSAAGRWAAEQWAASPLELRQALVAAAVVAVIVTLVVRLARPRFWVPRVAGGLAVVLAVAVAVVPLLDGQDRVSPPIGFAPLAPELPTFSPGPGDVDPRPPGKPRKPDAGNVAPRGGSPATPRGTRARSSNAPAHTGAPVKGALASTEGTKRQSSGCVCPSGVVVRKTTPAPDVPDVDSELPPEPDPNEVVPGDATGAEPPVEEGAESSTYSISCEYTTVNGETTGGCTEG